jgi:hypothetical protein
MLVEMEKHLTNFSSSESRVRCVAHISHLAVTDFLEKLGSAVFENEDELENEDDELENNVQTSSNPVNKVRNNYFLFKKLILIFQLKKPTSIFNIFFCSKN